MIGDCSYCYFWSRNNGLCSNPMSDNYNKRLSHFGGCKNQRSEPPTPFYITIQYIRRTWVSGLLFMISALNMMFGDKLTGIWIILVFILLELIKIKKT